LGIDLQKASMWKRISAWLFDSILLAVLAVAFLLLLSTLLGYDGYQTRLEQAYARVEEQYGVRFDITEEEYNKMTQAEKDRYDEAYDALVEDEEALYCYNMVLNLTLTMTAIGILLAVMTLEFVVPLLLKNGQTLGKKIFGLGVVRSDAVQANALQLFTRALLGKYTIGIMIPVYIIIMLFFNIMDVTGTVVVGGLALGQAICVGCTRNNCAIHDKLAGTVVVDVASQTVFKSTDDLIAYTKKLHAERAARQDY